ncbi:RICIN domain-containing protein [Marinagarivorans cellulosilyticus]|uniref:Uncharacterized protein n=1 Tax=Marinagarivorans cellulosilyticus TaxID=2721545 RepID=A0AAN1WE65_9GAMM|nr:RICIN domain-containing protein [Marinagarivorans cellulosilyticus]BCD95937.1 hypothetical protein MARGE09_P0136 [Marinagarivorans cellulosilyticus]
MKSKLTASSILFFSAYLPFHAYSFPDSSGDGDRSYTTNFDDSNLVSIIGVKEQTQAPLIDMNGRMLFEAYPNWKDKIPAFERLFEEAITPINWQYSEGYLPISQYTFRIPDFSVTVEIFSIPKKFSSVVNWEGDFAIVYARARLSYLGQQQKFSSIPIFNTGMTPINSTSQNCSESSCIIGVTRGGRYNFDFAISSERLTGPSNGSHDLKASEVQDIAGTFDAAKTNLIDTWKRALSGLPELIFPETEKNSEHLTNSMKTAAVQFNITRDFNQLDEPDLHEKNRQIKIGENGYDYVYDHDAQGILASAIELGLVEMTEAEELLRNLPAQRSSHDYLDSLGKLPWVAAKYVHKFDSNPELIKELTFEQKYLGVNGTAKSISEWTHYLIDTKQDSTDGLMVHSKSTDEILRSTVDNFATLLGLKAYAYLCAMIGKGSEKQWADNEYMKLYGNLTTRLLAMVESKDFDDRYLSASIDTLTENKPFDSSVPGFDNANSYASFFFGRMYETFLFGENFIELSPLIDNTLDIGLSMVDQKDLYLDENNNWNGNFGRYQEGWTTSGYNAAYAEGFLLGKGKYRSSFYNAFNYLMNYQSGPYTWFESIGVAQDQGVAINSITNSAASGHGSAPHMWSSMSQARLMLITLISQSYDDRLWLGRGVPNEWLDKGGFGVNDYTTTSGNKFNYLITKNSSTKEFELTFSGDVPADIIVSLPIFTEFDPVVIQYSGQPANYTQLATVIDVDSDGFNEIRISNQFQSNSKIKFLLQPKSEYIGDANRSRLRLSEIGMDIRKTDVIHMEHVVGSGPIKVGKLTPDPDGSNFWHSAMWVLEKINGHPGYFRIKNYHTNRYLHAEESGEAINADLISATNSSGSELSGWHSAHWSVDLAEDGRLHIRNRHRKAYLSINSLGNLKYSSTDYPKLGWNLDKVNGDNCTGLIEPDTSIRDNNLSRLRC